MKLSNPMSLAAIAVVALSFSSCIDDDYDLSDIDTTAEFQVKDLVLPVNIDEIKLQSIIDLPEGGQIKIVNDEYVFVQDGEYESSDVSIPQVYLDAPQVPSVVTSVDLSQSGVMPQSLFPSDFELNYPIGEQLSQFSYNTSAVSDFIVDMEKIGADFNIKIMFSIKGIDDIVDSYMLRNFKLQIVPGLDLSLEEGSYDAKTGILSLNDGKHYGSSLEFNIKISGVDINGAGIDYDHNSHSIVFDGKVGIYSGEIVIVADDLKEGVNILNIPKTIELHTDFDFSRMLITSFTGRIKYQLDGLDIAPVSLSNIPDILSQEKTDITLVNPQIYLSLNNPVAKYNLSAQAGITITANRNNGQSTEHSLDNGYFTIAGTPQNDMNVFCLSPQKPQTYYEGYESALHVPYSSLATVLSGNGLPKSLTITLDDPIVPEQDVKDFALGQSLGIIKGSYMFYSPLELAPQSQVVYRSTEDGWNDEDVDAITIKVLELSALITNELPLDIKITGYPVDVNGNKINNVDIEGVDVVAGAVDAPLTIRITGEITHLDGIAFEAVATQGQEAKALKPSEVIHLKNLRAKVSGNYIKEL